MKLRHLFCLVLFGLTASGLHAKDNDKEHYAQVAQLTATIKVESEQLKDGEATLRFTHRYNQEVAQGNRERLIRPHNFHCEWKAGKTSVGEWQVLPKNWADWTEIVSVQVEGNAWNEQTTLDFPGKMKIVDQSEKDNPLESFMDAVIINELVESYRNAPLTLHKFGPETLQEWTQSSTLFRGKDVHPKELGGRIHLNVEGDWQEQRFPPSSEIGWELLRQWEPIAELITLLGDEETQSATDTSVRARAKLKSHWNPTDELDYRVVNFEMDIELKFSNPLHETSKITLNIQRKVWSDK